MEKLMKPFIVVGLIFSLFSPSVAFAQGALLESATRAASQLGQLSQEPPNATKARRVVTELGVGEHVVVKLTSNQTLRGHLRAITEDHFVLLLDQVARPLEIAYDEVQKVEPNPEGGSVAIWGGVIAAAVVFGYLVKKYGQRGGCGQAAAQAAC
jgi:small nuclear ribonucleoprotein (snRNP)-like protein